MRHSVALNSIIDPRADTSYEPLSSDHYSLIFKLNLRIIFWNLKKLKKKNSIHFMNSISKGENHAQNSYWPNTFVQKKSRSYKKLLSLTHFWSLSTKFVMSHIMLLSIYINIKLWKKFFVYTTDLFVWIFAFVLKFCFSFSLNLILSTSIPRIEIENRFFSFAVNVRLDHFCFLVFFLCLYFWYLFRFLVADSAKSNQNEIRSSKQPSIRFKNGIPLHSDVDLTASCPRCLAAAAEKPNSDGELL